MARVLSVLIFSLFVTSAFAQNNSNSLKAIELSHLANNQVQLALDFQQTAPEPLSFSMDNPARLVLDFPEVKNALPKEKANYLVDKGIVKRIQTVEAQNKTRVIVQLNHHTAYQFKKQANQLLLTLSNAKQAEAFSLTENIASQNTKGLLI